MVVSQTLLSQQKKIHKNDRMIHQHDPLMIHQHDPLKLRPVCRSAAVPGLDVLKSFLQSLRQSPSALLPGLLSHEAVEEFPVQLRNKGLGCGWDGSFMGVSRFFAWKIGQLDQDPKISSMEKMSDAGKTYSFDGARHPKHQSLASHRDVHSRPKDGTKTPVASRCSSSWHQIA